VITKAKEHLVALICIGAFVAAGIGAVIGYQILLGSLAAEVAALEADAAAAESRLKTLQAQAEQRETQHLMASERFDQALPATLDIGAVLGRLGERLKAKQVELQDRQVRSGDTRNSTMVAQTPIKMRFESSFADAYELLRQIEQDEQIIRLHRLLVRRDMKEPREPLAVELELSVFSRRAKEAERWLTE